jgi:nitrogenase molybdenum-iron protein alpha chain
VRKRPPFCRHSDLSSEVLAYPGKAKNDRAKHLVVNDHSIKQSKKCITSNRKSQPGVMTIRGCAYAGEHR